MSVPIRLLLVEDSEDDAKLLIRTLDRAGYTTEFARVETPDSLNAALEQHSWDAVIADYALPGFNGIQALRAVRTRGLDIPFIMVSGEISDEMGARAMQSGAHDYLMKDNLSRLVPALQRELQEAAERRSLREAEARIRKTEEKLRIAREIQRKLFPDAAPDLPGFELAGGCFPAEATGGDYYDYLRLQDGCLGLAVGDVSGHGLGPALLMAETRAYLQALAETHSDVGEMLTRLNRFLADDTEEERFVTLFLVKLDPQTPSFAYAGAGHSAYVLNASGETRLLTSTGMVLGLEREHVIATSPTMPLQPEDLLLLVTDGIVETQAPDGSLFGELRMLACVHEHRHLPASDILSQLYRAARQYSRRRPQNDDITVVILKRLA